MDWTLIAVILTGAFTGMVIIPSLADFLYAKYRMWKIGRILRQRLERHPDDLGV